MNPRIEKLRAEHEKNAEKIARLQARNKKIDEDVLALENTDILGIVRDSGISLAQLAAMMQNAGANSAPFFSPDTETDKTEDEN